MKNVAIFYGGRSFEHDISIITAIQIMNNADKTFNLIPVYMKNGEMTVPIKPKLFGTYIAADVKGKKAVFCKNGLKIGLKSVKIDVALIACHGGEGEDGTLVSLLEYYGIRYTTAKAESMALCMNKYLFKQYLKGKGLEAVDGVLAEKGNPLPTIAKYPVIVKPNRLGSSIGVSVAKDSVELESALKIAFEFDEEVLIEELLNAPLELSCASFFDGKNVVLSCIEKEVKTDAFFTFEEKYVNETSAKEYPAVIDKELEERISELTSKLTLDLKLYGITRTDFLYLPQEDRLYVNEINTIPGSLGYYLFMSKGISFRKLLTMLILSCESRSYGSSCSYYDSGVLSNYTTGGKLTK